MKNSIFNLRPRLHLPFGAIKSFELSAGSSYAISPIPRREMSLDEYKLSCELVGHSLDVRALAVGNNFIVSGSRDKTAKIWEYNGFVRARIPIHCAIVRLNEIFFSFIAGVATVNALH